jgi:hypothetical protein
MTEYTGLDFILQDGSTDRDKWLASGHVDLTFPFPTAAALPALLVVSIQKKIAPLSIFYCCLCRSLVSLKDARLLRQWTVPRDTPPITRVSHVSVWCRIICSSNACCVRTRKWIQEQQPKERRFTLALVPLIEESNVIINKKHLYVGFVSANNSGGLHSRSKAAFAGRTSSMIRRHASPRSYIFTLTHTPTNPGYGKVVLPSYAFSIARASVVSWRDQWDSGVGPGLQTCRRGAPGSSVHC